MRNKPFQCKRDKMYTVLAFQPALIALMNIFADQFGDRQNTKVYNNGVMQVSVFVSVNYNGDTNEGILDQIKRYVQVNATIYSLNYGENVKWKNSTTDNGYHHDIDHTANKNASVPPKLGSDIRVPLYFTVPGGTAEGEHRWIAKMDDGQTSVNKPLTINVRRFEVSHDYFEIVEKAYIYCHSLRALKYRKDKFPDHQKLLKLVEYKGIKFIGSGGNVWVTMSYTKGQKLGIFLDYSVSSNIKVAKAKHVHWSKEMVKKDVDDTGYKNWINCDCLSNSLKFDPADIKNTWNTGIAMLLVRSAIMYKQYSAAGTIYYAGYNAHEFIIEDNFGGRIKITINWDGGDWYGNWAVKDAEAVYP